MGLADKGPERQSQRPLSSNSIVIAVAGDVLPEPVAGPLDGERLLDLVRGEFARADLTFLNLEEPITNTGTVTPDKNPAEVTAGHDYVLRARNFALPRVFRDAGVGVVGLANNHMMDYTARGLRDTLTAFRAVGLPVVGAGVEPEAERAFVFGEYGRRVALLAFSDVVPPNSQATRRRCGIASAKNPDHLVKAIQRARQEADFVVLMIHWGGQGKHLITRRQQYLAQVATYAGCDAVVGMHPHVLQGVEYIGRTPVFYSIGNFAFRAQAAAARECVLVRLTFGQHKLEAVELIPVEILPTGAPHLAQDARGQRILAHVDGFCRMFNTQVRDGKVVAAPVREKIVYDMTADNRNSQVVIGGRKNP